MYNSARSIIQAYLRLSFGILQDCHRVRVWNCMAHNGWTEHSSQVRHVHPSVQTLSNSERFYDIQLSL